jgi:hypothetical protein
MRIKDQNGRIGTVTSETDGGFFAKPEGVPYKMGDKDGITGVSNAVLITATHWHRETDGTLTGLWFDSPLHTHLTATIIPDASDMGRKGGAVKSERKAASSRENGRKGGRPRKVTG